MICPTDTRLYWAVEAARLGLKENGLLAAVMANWAVALRRKRYLAVRKWKRIHRERSRYLDQLSYERTKVLKGRPPKLTPDQKRQHRRESQKRRRDKINARERERIRTDLQYCIARRLRSCIRFALKRVKANKAYDLTTRIGCSLEAFVRHIESLFALGMSLENRSLWHIHHIVPLAVFDLTDPEEQKWCCNWRNMKPLWALENRMLQDTLPNPIPDWLPVHIATRILERTHAKA